jgi:hypothetical protein
MPEARNQKCVVKSLEPLSVASRVTFVQEIPECVALHRHHLIRGMLCGDRGGDGMCGERVREEGSIAAGTSRKRSWRHLKFGGAHEESHPHRLRLFPLPYREGAFVMVTKWYNDGVMMVR